jgi:hypothetical protein
MSCPTLAATGEDADGVGAQRFVEFEIEHERAFLGVAAVYTS